MAAVMRLPRALATPFILPQMARRGELFQSRSVLNRQTATAIQLALNRPPTTAASTAAAGSSSKGRCHLSDRESQRRPQTRETTALPSEEVFRVRSAHLQRPQRDAGVRIVQCT